jgi:integrase
MGQANNLTRRGGVYYLRFYVPSKLQALIRTGTDKPTKEISESLKTKDLSEAKRRVRKRLIELDKEFAALGAKHAKVPLDKLELENAVWDRFTSVTAADESRRATHPSNEELDATWVAIEEDGGPDVESFRILEAIGNEPEADTLERRNRLAALLKDAKSNSVKTILPIVSQVIKKRRLDVSPNSVDERLLARSLSRADIEALKVMAKRDEGDFSGIPTDPIVKPPTTIAPPVAAPGESIMELFDIYASENPNMVTAGTLAQSRKVVDLFSQFLGKHFPARSLGKKEVREWKAALKSFPIKATESNDFRGMDFNKIISANKGIGKKAISAKTLNRYLGSIGTFCRWLVSQGYMEHSPTPGMALTVDKAEKNVLPYSISQLNDIFQSPLFRGCRSLKMAHKSGDFLIRDHHYWLPLIALFSGARVNELCQLLSTNVRQIKENWVFDITAETDTEQKLKTKSSARIVPIHPKLIELGLVNYVHQKQLAGDKWLFPEIVQDSRQRRSGRYSDFYNKYIKRIGVKEDKTINFHSYRHTFADALRRADALDAEVGLMLGHADGSQTAKYGSIKQGEIERRVRLVNGVDYEGLELSHLISSK